MVKGWLEPFKLFILGNETYEVAKEVDCVEKRSLAKYIPPIKFRPFTPKTYLARLRR